MPSLRSVLVVPLVIALLVGVYLHRTRELRAPPESRLEGRWRVRPAESWHDFTSSPAYAQAVAGLSTEAIGQQAIEYRSVLSGIEIEFLPDRLVLGFLGQSRQDGWSIESIDGPTWRLDVGALDRPFSSSREFSPGLTVDGELQWTPVVTWRGPISLMTTMRVRTLEGRVGTLPSVTLGRVDPAVARTSRSVPGLPLE